MKTNVKVSIIVGILVVSAIVVPIIVFQIRDRSYYDHGGTVRSRYLIEKDEDFTKKYHFSGSGTMADPYLLAN